MLLGMRDKSTAFLSSSLVFSRWPAQDELARWPHCRQRFLRWASRVGPCVCLAWKYATAQHGWGVDKTLLARGPVQKADQITDKQSS